MTTEIKCYEGRGGARKPSGDGFWTPDTNWQYIQPYTNNGQWTDTDWQNFPDNSRYYPMDDNSATLVDEIGGHDGTIQNYDAANWMAQVGASAAQVSTLWGLMLESRGYAGQRNDAWFQLLRDQGYTGSLNDMELQFWQAGGTLPPPV